MTISTVLKDGILTVSVDGRIDANSSSQLQSSILSAFQKSAHIVIDFAKVSYISSIGLRALLIGQKTANSKRAVMELKNVSAPVLKILESVGFTDIRTIC